MKERHLLMQSSESEGLWKDGSESLETSVICVKCSEWYSIPDDYECHDTVSIILTLVQSLSRSVFVQLTINNQSLGFSRQALT